GIRRVQMEKNQPFAGWFGHGFDSSVLVEEHLVAFDQSVEAGFLWPVFRAVFSPPGAIAFFNPQRHQRAASDRPGAELGTGLQERRIKRRLILDPAVQLPAEISGEGDAQRQHLDPRDAYAL